MAAVRHRVTTETSSAQVPAKHGSPYVKEVKSDGEVHDPRLNLGALRKALPKEVFEKSIRRSMQWMVWDMGIVFVLLWVGKNLVYDADSGWLASPVAKFSALTLLTWITGFFQASVFIVGHDCGHGTFSDYPLLNFICGLITHGSLLVPYSAWQRSHRFHHMYHNHLEKDMSYHWLHDPALDPPGSQMHSDSVFAKAFRALVLPFMAYAYYLAAPEFIGSTAVGVDGCHYLPFASVSGKLWKDCSTRDMIECFISIISMGVWAMFFTRYFYGGSFMVFCVLFMPCYFVFGFFLFVITYLQHHGPNTKVYDESTWSYTTAGFETIDLNYGWLVNFLHHHIADCHVVHHLFFTKIPHYNLKLATDGMVKWLRENELEHLYKSEDALDFPFRMMRYIWHIGLRAVLVTKNAKAYYANA